MRRSINCSSASSKGDRQSAVALSVLCMTKAVLKRMLNRRWFAPKVSGYSMLFFDTLHKTRSSRDCIAMDSRPDESLAATGSLVEIASRVIQVFPI